MSKTNITAGQRLEGCLIGGAIGDAVGSFYEGRTNIQSVEYGNLHGITDDTQLTLATCEAILESQSLSPDAVAGRMLAWYNNRKLSGLGSSTLKALRDLQVGAHWGLSGRSGEYAAGNGAAMRIAPLAFFTDIQTERTLIRDICNITHKNDEAYVGCLSILYALHFIITDQWSSDKNLLQLITAELPDTAVRDNLMQLQDNTTLCIQEAAHLVGTSGHVVESVPFSIFAAQKIKESCFEDIISQIIHCGGDTDTNASLAGQIMGTFIGSSGFSVNMLSVFKRVRECDYISQIAWDLTKKIKTIN